MKEFKCNKCSHNEYRQGSRIYVVICKKCGREQGR
jgi:transcription elongation factor Elf1